MGVYECKRPSFNAEMKDFRGEPNSYGHGSEFATVACQIHSGTGCYLLRMRSSTRRFWALPSAVLLLATGLAGP